MLIENFETWLGASRVWSPDMEADERLRACWDNAFEAGRSYGIDEGKGIALEEAEEKYYDYDDLKSLRDDITSTGEAPDELIAFYDEWHDKAEKILDWVSIVEEDL